MRNFKSIIGLSLLLLMFNLSHAQDWANLNRYKSDNETIGLPKKGEKRVVFLGSSIIEFWKKEIPDFFKESYINRGIGGQTSPQLLLRFKADVINLKPAVVIILAGSNDIAGNTGPTTIEQITDNIFAMAELAKVHRIKVVLCANLPVYDYPWKQGVFPAAKIIELNELIRKYAERNGLVYLDFHSALKDERNGTMAIYTKDGVHPNEAGYSIMIPLCEQAIKKARK
ncbi:SGNH/GDSL hydrolase family protein [Pedobacter frigiditerrae]|uniref:SGNH/GDSL hydrolase family protein n=1 Tax=Pedobacter frigiditerrae TaxID=2530452 RepID=UPI0029306642|nr:SGNH/GDSL hydrolase family protein [Pedobacter frigiditerrae]